MKYQEVYHEYTAFLNQQTQLRQRLNGIPKGYITVKRIAGKEYYYLQYTSFGKKKSEYIRESDVSTIREKLIQGEMLRKEIGEIDVNLDRLERAAKILDEQLSRTFYYLRQCAVMDTVPISKRNAVLSFSRAVTSLEGLSAREVTEENLRLWARGEKSFADFYLPALQGYRVMEGLG